MEELSPPIVELPINASRRDFIKIAGAVVVVAAAGTAGYFFLTGGPAAVRAPTRQRIVIAQGVDPSTLDPDQHRETPTAIVNLHFYDPLWQVNQKGEYEPMLATSWTWTSPTALEVTLRRDVKFTSGEPFNAEVAKYNLGRVAGVLSGAKPTLNARDFAMIKSVDVLDEFRFRINLKAPSPLLVPNLRNKLMVPKKYTEQNGFDALATNAVGTGPYALKEWVKSDHLTLVRRDDYWRTPAAIKEVVFRPIPEAATRLAELKVGSVDIITNVPADQVASVNANPNTEVRAVPSVRVAMVFFNAELPVLHDKRVRQALNYAVDVDSIIKNVFQGFAKRVTTVSPSNFLPNPANDRFYPFDLAKAKQLLADAGLPNGFDGKLLVPRGRYLLGEDAAQAVAGMLQKVNVRIQLEVVEFGVFAKLTQEHKIPELMYAAWGNNTFNAVQTLDNLVHTGRPFSWYKNPEVDRLIDEASATTDLPTHKQLLTRALDIMFDDPPFIFLYQQVDVYGANKSLQWQPRSDELIYAYEAR